VRRNRCCRSLRDRRGRSRARRSTSARPRLPFSSRQRRTNSPSARASIHRCPAVPPRYRFQPRRIDRVAPEQRRAVAAHRIRQDVTELERERFAARDADAKCARLLDERGRESEVKYSDVPSGDQPQQFSTSPPRLRQPARARAAAGVHDVQFRIAFGGAPRNATNAPSGESRGNVHSPSVVVSRRAMRRRPRRARDRLRRRRRCGRRQSSGSVRNRSRSPATGTRLGPSESRLPPPGRSAGAVWQVSLRGNHRAMDSDERSVKDLIDSVNHRVGTANVHSRRHRAAGPAGSTGARSPRSSTTSSTPSTKLAPTLSIGSPEQKSA